jgi:hypothetical protein
MIVAPLYKYPPNAAHNWYMLATPPKDAVSETVDAPKPNDTALLLFVVEPVTHSM